MRGCFLAAHKVNIIYSEKTWKYSAAFYVLFFAVIYFRDSCKLHSKLNFLINNEFVLSILRVFYFRCVYTVKGKIKSLKLRPVPPSTPPSVCLLPSNSRQIMFRTTGATAIILAIISTLVAFMATLRVGVLGSNTHRVWKGAIPNV